MTHEEQVELVQSKLGNSPNDWRLKAFSLIDDAHIPLGHLISYGNLARWVNQEFGLEIGPRNVAWLRAKIYGILCGTTDPVTGHETSIPIHRIANDGDLKSTRDDPYTQEVNNRRRSAEGSRYNPIWIVK